MSTIDGRESTDELLTMATRVSRTVMLATIDSGSAQRTLSLIVPTSRVTRVTRSPELALSTRESGRRRMARTTYSLAVARTLWPSTVEENLAARVNALCTTTSPATTS